MKFLRTSLVVACMLALATLPAAAQAGKVTCKDGSKSAGGRGACSGHGGVLTASVKADVKADAKAMKAEKKADAKAEKKADARAEKKAEAKAEKKADQKMNAMAKEDEKDARGATAECKDHTYSHAKSHQGACSRHGGVAKFIGK
jgi:membrane protein involved in colicin uptake